MSKEALNAAATKIRAAQMYSKTELLAEIERVCKAPEGMGFVGVTEKRLQACGTTLAAVEAVALRKGLRLVAGTHGRHGTVFAK